MQLAWVHGRLGCLREVLMPRQTPRLPSDIRDALLQMYAANDGMNQLLLTHLDRRAERVTLPGPSSPKGRTVAAIENSVVSSLGTSEVQ